VVSLPQQDGDDIIVLASGSVVRVLLETGELDRLSITLCPELGGGARLFRDGQTGPVLVVAGVTTTETLSAASTTDPHHRLKHAQQRTPAHTTGTSRPLIG